MTAPTPAPTPAPPPAPVPTPPPIPPTPTPDVRWWTHLRRGAALLVVLVAAGGFFYVRSTGDLEKCTTKTVRTDDVPAKVSSEENCEPIPVESMVPVFLLVIALMWADLASVEILGLGTVTRRLNEQDARQNQLEAAQLSLQNTVQSSAVAQTNLYFANSAEYALGTEVLARRQLDSGEAPPTGAPTSDRLSDFETAVEPLKAWLLVDQRMRDPTFASAVQAGAASGNLSDSTSLVSRDKDLLKQIERPGTPFAVDQMRAWSAENQTMIRSVRETLQAGAGANPEALRIAAAFCNQLLSDLRRHGLVPTA